MKGDASKLDHTKDYAFHQSVGHTTKCYFKWKNYFEKLMKEDMCDKCLDKLATQLRWDAEDVEPPAKVIRINETFVEFEYLQLPTIPRKGRSNRRDR
ncbi:hypothetical protein ACFX2H_022475 [Malus domestica]